MLAGVGVGSRDHECAGRLLSSQPVGTVTVLGQPWSLVVDSDPACCSAALPETTHVAVAALSHLMMSDYTDWPPVAGALAMAAAITVKLVAPVQRFSADAPVFERPPESKKPRLLYDKTAMVMELIVGSSDRLFRSSSACWLVATTMVDSL